MVDLLLIAIKYSLVSNVVLSQFLGICAFLGVSKKSSASKGMGAAVIFVTVLASIVSHLIYVGIMSASSPICKALGIKDGLDFLNTIVFILLIAALVQLVEMFMKKNMKSLYDALGVYLPLITTNCAVLGVSIINAEQMETFGLAITNALGAGIGFSLAILLFAGVRDRMSKNEIPKPFQGMPIALISASVMAVVFSGFKGLGG